MLFDLDLTTGLLTLTVGFVVWYLYRSQVKDADVPPWPCRPLPVLGHLHTLGQQDCHEKWRQQLGDVYSLKFGPKLFVFLNGYPVIREALVKKADDFSDRQTSYFDQVLKEKNVGIITASGPAWKETRTVTISILRSLGMGKNVLADKIQEEVSIFLKFLQDLGSEPRDIRSTVSKSVSNVTCSILLGERFDYDDPNFTKMLELLDYNIRMFASPGLLMVNMWPWLAYLPGDLFHVKKMVQNIRIIRALFIQHFKAKRGHEVINDDSLVDNFVAAYKKELRKREDRGDHTVLSDTNLERTLDDLFGPGSETTGTTINWAVHYAISHPHIQDKIHAELDREVGRNRIPNIQDKARLPYLNAFINEVQRYGNILPLGVAHMVRHDVQLANYRIPAGSIAIYNMTTVFFDPDVWGDDVNTFRPERFLDKEGNLTSPEEFIPFSVGRRACPAEALAKMSLFLYLANMFHKFTFVNPDPTHKVETQMGLTFTPGPFNVQVVPRDDS